MPSDLQALLSRLEAAQGADRELDAALWLVFTPGATRRTLHVPHWKKPYEIDETRDATGRLIVVPAVTASIDAALALVERVLPGWDWSVHSHPKRQGEPHFQDAWAGVRAPPKGPVSGVLHEANGYTPALALLIALVQAKIAMEQADAD